MATNIQRDESEEERLVSSLEMQMLRLLGDNDNNDDNDDDSIEAAEYAAFLSEINSNNNNNNSLEAIWSEISSTNNHGNDDEEEEDGGPTTNTTTRMIPISNFNYFDSPPHTATTTAHAITNEACVRRGTHAHPFVI